MSQKEVVLRHLKAAGSITSVEAEAVHKVRRLASRIDELRQDGHAIRSIPKRDMAGQRYVRYSLENANA